MKKGTVYIITNEENGMIYVGETTVDLNIRMNHHRYNSNHFDSDLYMAMKEFGSDKFTIREYKIVDASNLTKEEEKAIKDLNSMSPNGYNMTSSAMPGSVKSKSFVDKMKNSWTDEKRLMFRDIYKKNLNFINAKGQVKAVEKRRLHVQLLNTETNEIETFNSLTDCAHDKNWSIAALSRKLKDKRLLFKKYLIKLESDETTFDEMLMNSYAKKEDASEKMSIAKIGNPSWNKGLTTGALSEETKQKLRLVQGKRVKCLDDGLEFSSARQAAGFYKINQSSVAAVCRGHRKTVGNKSFTYIKEE